VPINVGDGVLTFLGDATSLEGMLDTLPAKVSAKMKPAEDAARGVGTELDNAGKKGAEAGEKISNAWIKVARATQDNQIAQKELKVALESAKKAGSDDSVAMAELAAAQEKAAAAARNLTVATKEARTAGESEVVDMRQRREAAAAYGELTGNTIPRGLRTWLAEMKLVGPAMEAAFSVLAPLLLLSVLSEGINKLIEWHEASEKLREEWTASDTQFRTTSNSIRDEINQQEEDFIRLTQGPIAAYEFALKHIKSTFDETVGKIGGELDQQGDKFINRGGFFSSLFGGEEKANAKSAGKDLKEFSALLQEVGKKAQDLHPENPFAGMDAMLDRINGKIKETTTAIQDEQEEIRQAKARDAGGVPSALLGFDASSLERMRAVLQEAQQLLQQSRDREKAARDADTARIKSDEIAHQKDIDGAKLTVHQAFLLATLSVNEENQRIAFERGKESLNQFLQQQKTNEVEKYNIEKKGYEDQLALANKDKVRNEQEIITINGHLEDLRIQHHLRMLQIDQAAYVKQADQVVKALENVVASTKDGSEDRINAEQAVLDFLEITYGRESDAFLAQQNRVTAAIQSHVEVRKTLALKEVHYNEALIADKESAEVAYYSFLRSSAQVSAVTLLKIQQDASEKAYQSKRAALLYELNQLGPQEVVARQKLNADITMIDQKHEEEKRLMYAQTVNIIELEYQQLGIKSTMMYMRERDLAKQSYEAIARSGTASYGQLLAAQIKVFQAQIALNAAEGKNTAKDQAALDKLIATYHKWELAIKGVNSQGKIQESILKGLGVDARLMGSTISNVALGATAALQQMFQAWASGGVTVAQACAQITAAILQSVAQYAFVKAIEQMALGFAAMSPTSPDFGHAGEHFTSAGLWFLVGAGASVAGGLVSRASSGGGSTAPGSTGSSTSLASPGQNQTTPPPVQSVNVQSFAGGGLITKRTMAVMGDAANGGDAAEAALPLDDPKAMQAVGDAIAPHISGGGGIHNHFHIKGLVSPDSLTKVMEQMNRKVQRGQGNLVASNALRVTKRSS
jgi:hypothetical protein